MYFQLIFFGTKQSKFVQTVSKYFNLKEKCIVNTTQTSSKSLNNWTAFSLSFAIMMMIWIMSGRNNIIEENIMYTLITTTRSNNVAMVVVVVWWWVCIVNKRRSSNFFVFFHETLLISYRCSHNPQHNSRH